MSDSVRAALGVSFADAHQQKFVAWNSADRSCSTNALVHHLVASHAAAAPAALAIGANKRVVTYAELNTRANQIGHLLHSLGVGPDTLVGLYMARSAELVVAALGILKSGGAYMPLDPSYPEDRAAFMLNDAAPTVVLSEQRFAKRLAAGKWHTVMLDIEGPQIARHPIAEPNYDVRKENLAYVIYTSGSTGMPKGVEIMHSSLLNLVHWHQQTFGINASDRASQLAGFGFDAVVWEIWPYLTAGASVHLFDEVALNEPEAVRDWLVSEKITIGFLPTPLAERVIKLDWPAKTTLRTMLTGADTLHHHPSPKLSFQLVNNYGPTECTVVATSGTVLPNEQATQLPAIGRPIANTEIYILDEKMRQVSMGGPGQIYIGGAGVARGYRKRPELTAERFVANPFSSNPGARLYKTGDLGRYLPDGQIAFLGRIDEQIKIRGFRIEPAEIVAVLDQHPMVEASIVLGREDEPGDKRLIAYLCPIPGSRPTLTELRNFIAARLPEYMIPATFVKLDTLPLNASGKVDRAALPAANAGNIICDDTLVEPRTPIEKRMAEILATLLHLGSISAEDNFFMLGGHSLVATQLIARVRDTFGVEVGLRTVFEGPTIKELSAKIEAALIAKLEAMSEEEAQCILKTKQERRRSLS